MGVRKVLGARILDIVGLVSRSYVQYLFLANLVAWPIAYWMTRNWLSNFAFRIDQSIDLFLLPGLVASSLAILTVSGHALRSAQVDPVRVLRSE